VIRFLLPRVLIAVTLTGCVCLAWPGPGLTRNPAPAGKTFVLPESALQPAQSDLQWMGVASCASVACHHANGPKGSWRSEYTTWAGHDKHAQAYRVLYDQRSEMMVRNLYGDKAVAATRTELCLKCHAMNDGNEKDTGPRFTLLDGVGCESCHGPAEKYLDRHYEGDIQSLRGAEKVVALSALGMTPTKDLGTRIKLCVKCHLGEKGQEVNHDLIAAGHPRLNFEFASYQAIYPRHWNRQKDLGRYADFEVRSWILGQLVASREALALLESRAADDSKPWPEFAEYACFACHKDLQVNSPRQRAGYGDRKPGSFPWGTWNVTMLEGYAEEVGKGEEILPALEQLRKVMEAPSPDPARVAPQAASAVKTLDGWIARASKADAMPAAAARELMRKFAGRGAVRADTQTWDETAQLYLALAAFHEGLKDMGAAPPELVKTDLLKVKGRLKGAFPPGFNSPRKFDPLEKPKLSNLFSEVRIQLAP
jgi:hypothetical protein